MKNRAVSPWQANWSRAGPAVPGNPSLRGLRTDRRRLLRRGKPQIAGLAVRIHHDCLSVANDPLEQEPAERRLDLLLDGAFQRARPVVRVVAGADQVLERAVGQFQRDVALGQPRPQTAELNL